MATASEIVNGAYRKLGIKPADSAITGEEMLDGIETLNDMMFELENSGTVFGYEQVSSPDDVVRIPEGTENFVKVNLAGYMAPDLSVAISPGLAAQISISKNNMLKIILKPIIVRHPDTLPVGSGNNCGTDFTYDDRFFHPGKKQNF